MFDNPDQRILQAHHDIMAREDRDIFDILNSIEEDRKRNPPPPLSPARKTINCLKRRFKSLRRSLVDRRDRIKRGLGWIFTNEDYDREEQWDE